MKKTTATTSNIAIYTLFKIPAFHHKDNRLILNNYYLKSLLLWVECVLFPLDTLLIYYLTFKKISILIYLICAIILIK